MPQYVRLPDGNLFPLKEGEDPASALSAAEKLYPQAFGLTQKAPEESPKSGFMPSLKGAVADIKGAGAALAGRTGIMDLPAAEKYIAEQEAYKKKTVVPTQAGWTEDPLAKISELAGGSIPYIVAPLIAGGAAAALPLTGLAATAAGVGAAGLASAGQFAGSNLIRQMQPEEGRPKTALKDTDLTNAALAAIPMAALDILSLRMFPGVGKILQSAGINASEQVVANYTKEALKKTAADYFLATGKTMGREGLTEAGQQVFERMQAGLSITNEAARKEYFDSFVGGAVLGGVIAPAGRYVERGGEQSRFDTQQREEQKAQADAARVEQDKLDATTLATKQTPEYAQKAQADYVAAEQRQKELEGQIHKASKGNKLTEDQKQDNRETQQALAEHATVLKDTNKEYRQYRQFLPKEPAPPLGQDTTQLQQRDMFGNLPTPKTPELDMQGKPVERAAPEPQAEDQGDLQLQIRGLSDYLNRLRDENAKIPATDTDAKIAIGEKYSSIKKMLTEVQKIVPPEVDVNAISTKITDLTKKIAKADTNGDVDISARYAAQIKELQKQLETAPSAPSPQQQFEMQPFQSTVTGDRQLAIRPQYAANLNLGVEEQEADIAAQQAQAEEQYRAQGREQDRAIKVGMEAKGLQRIGERPVGGVSSMQQFDIFEQPYPDTGSSAALNQVKKVLTQGEELPTAEETQPVEQPQPQRGGAAPFKLRPRQEGTAEPVTAAALRDRVNQLQLREDLSDEAYAFLRRADANIGENDLAITTERVPLNYRDTQGRPVGVAFVKDAQGKNISAKVTSKASATGTETRDVPLDQVAKYTFEPNNEETETAGGASLFTMLDEQLGKIERGEEGVYGEGALTKRLEITPRGGEGTGAMARALRESGAALPSTVTGLPGSVTMPTAAEKVESDFADKTYKLSDSERAKALAKVKKEKYDYLVELWTDKNGVFQKGKSRAEAARLASLIKPEEVEQGFMTSTGPTAISVRGRAEAAPTMNADQALKAAIAANPKAAQQANVQRAARQLENRGTMRGERAKAKPLSLPRELETHLRVKEELAQSEKDIDQMSLFPEKEVPATALGRATPGMFRRFLDSKIVKEMREAEARTKVRKQQAPKVTYYFGLINELEAKLNALVTESDLRGTAKSILKDNDDVVALLQQYGKFKTDPMFRTILAMTSVNNEKEIKALEQDVAVYTKTLTELDKQSNAAKQSVALRREQIEKLNRVLSGIAPLETKLEAATAQLRELQKELKKEGATPAPEKTQEYKNEIASLKRQIESKLGFGEIGYEAPAFVFGQEDAQTMMMFEAALKKIKENRVLVDTLQRQNKKLRQELSQFSKLRTTAENTQAMLADLSSTLKSVSKAQDNIDKIPAVMDAQKTLWDLEHNGKDPAVLRTEIAQAQVDLRNAIVAKEEADAASKEAAKSPSTKAYEQASAAFKKRRPSIDAELVKLRDQARAQRIKEENVRLYGAKQKITLPGGISVTPITSTTYAGKVQNQITNAAMDNIDAIEKEINELKQELEDKQKEGLPGKPQQMQITRLESALQEANEFYNEQLKTEGIAKSNKEYAKQILAWPLKKLKLELGTLENRVNALEDKIKVARAKSLSYFEKQKAKEAGLVTFASLPPGKYPEVSKVKVSQLIPSERNKTPGGARSSPVFAFKGQGAAFRQTEILRLKRDSVAQRIEQVEALERQGKTAEETQTKEPQRRASERANVAPSNVTRTGPVTRGVTSNVAKLTESKRSGRPISDRQQQLERLQANIDAAQIKANEAATNLKKATEVYEASKGQPAQVREDAKAAYEAADNRLETSRGNLDAAKALLEAEDITKAQREKLGPVSESTQEFVAATGARPMLSRGTPVKGQTVESLKEELRKVMGGDVTSRGNVEIYDNVEEYIGQQDADLQDELRKQIPSDAKGFAQANKAVLFAENIGKNEGLGVLLHEVGVHIGFRNFFNEGQYKALVNQIRQWAKRTDGSIEAKIGAAAMRRVEAANTQKSHIDDELLAYAVEEAVKMGVNPQGVKGGSALRNWLNMVIAAFKKALNAFGINPTNLQAGDLVNFAYGCAQLELKGTWHGSDATFTKFDVRKAGAGEGVFDRRFDADNSLGAGPYTTPDKEYGEYYQHAIPFGKAANETGYGNKTYEDYRSMDEKFMTADNSKLSVAELQSKYESVLLSRYLSSVSSGGALNPVENKTAQQYISASRDRLTKSVSDWEKALASREKRKARESSLEEARDELTTLRRELKAINTLDATKINGLTKRPAAGNLYRALDDIPSEKIFSINSTARAGERPQIDVLLKKYGDKYNLIKFEDTGTYYLNSLYYGMREKLGVEKANALLKDAGIEALEQKNDRKYIERAYIDNAPEILAVNLKPVGTTNEIMLSRKADYKSDDALTKLAKKAVAQDKTYKEQAGSHIGLQIEMAAADMRAGVIKALNNAVEDPRTMGSTKLFRQAIFSITAADQAMSTTQMSLSVGPPKMVKDAKGYYSVNSSMENDAGQVFDAVQDIPDSYGDAQAKMGLASVYMIAQRALNKGLKKLDLGALGVTEQELQDAMAAANADPKLKAALENVRKKYNAYNRGMIEWLSSPQVAAISQADAKAYLKDEDYVPYYRVRADGTAELVFGGEKTLTIGDIRHQPYLAELKGGEAKIMPLDKSIMRNTMLLVTKGMNNMAMKNVGYAMQAAGDGLGPIGKNGKPTNLMPVLSGKGPDQANVIRWTQEPDPSKPDDKGDRYLRVETNGTLFGGIPAELIIKSLDGAHLTLPAFLKWGGIAGDLLRSGITRTPIYLARQLFRDPFAATATSGLDYGPITAIFKANKEFLKIAAGKSETGAKMIEKGLLQSGLFEGDITNMSKIALQLASGKSQGAIDRVLAGADRLALQADAATRALIYDNAIKNGLSEAEADYSVRESMNFSKRGLSPTVQYASRLIPFFNAQIQGLSVLVKAATGNMPAEDVLKIKRKFANNAMMLTGFGLAYAMAMDDDEYYKNAKPRDRYSNFFIPLPGVDEPLKLPIPYEFGFFFSAGVAMADAIKGEVDTPQQLRAIKDMFVGAIPGASSYFVPQLVKPLAEVYANRSFFSGTPLESTRLEKLAPEARYNAHTTEVAKWMATMVPGLSPIQIEHIVSGYLGQIPLMVLASTNEMFREGKEEPTRKLSEMPLIGSSFQRKYGGEDADVVYKLANDAMEAKRTFDSYRKTGKLEDAKEFLADNRAEIMVAPLAMQYQKFMGALRTQEDIIRNSNASPDAKEKRIDALNAQRQLQSERYLKAIRRAEAASGRTTPQ